MYKEILYKLKLNIFLYQLIFIFGRQGKQTLKETVLIL
jgi:hypothetical protein